MIDRNTEQPFCATDVSGSTFVNADCFDVFPFIEDKSIDAIICDLPYGTTACKWDSILPFDKLWKEYERIIKPNGAIVLFGSQPFTSALIMSNPKLFKYEWIWKKSRPANFMNAKFQAMKIHENIIVFGIGKTKYNPIKELGNKNHATKPRNSFKESIYNERQPIRPPDTNEMKYPKSIIEVKSSNNIKNEHPTQKPLELMEYLVKTYTDEGDIVLDNTMGSGTTNLACIKLNRKSIGIEKEKQYYDVAVRRASEYCH
jgi:DNA modification methylase